jgi:acyl-CoA dehydrogenase
MPEPELQAQTTAQDQQAIRQSVRELCRDFPDTYWRKVDKAEEYPEAFVKAVTESGYLAALIPEEYGGAGMGIIEASIILEEINKAGANSGACHAQMYTMGTLLRHGNEDQKRRYLPQIARGELRLQAFAVTEPNSGSEATRIQTRAVRKGDKYVVNGQKIFISRVKQSDLMLLLARTTPYDDVKDKTQGISVFIVDMRNVRGKLDVQPIDMMVNHHTNSVFFEDVEVPAENLIGEEGRGFSYIIDGWNVERILVASEAIGDGRWFIDRAVKYASDRVLFGKPIGANQGIQFSIA